MLSTNSSYLLNKEYDLKSINKVLIILSLIINERACSLVTRFLIVAVIFYLFQYIFTIIIIHKLLYFYLFI